MEGSQIQAETEQSRSGWDFRCLGAALLLCLVCIWPAVRLRKQIAKGAATDRVHELGMSAMLYSADADDHFPRANVWMDELMLYAKNTEAFRAPGYRAAGQFGFAFRRSLSTRSTHEIRDPSGVALIFDSTNTSWNANGELNLLPNPSRWSGGYVAADAEGDDRFVPDGSGYLH